MLLTEHRDPPARIRRFLMRCDRLLATGRWNALDRFLAKLTDAEREVLEAHLHQLTARQAQASSESAPTPISLYRDAS